MRLLFCNSCLILLIRTNFLKQLGLIYLIAFLFPLLAFSQKEKDINILVECVEYVGNDKFIANFGYDNPNSYDIVVPDTSSILIYNNGNTKTKAVNTFKSGRHSYVFSAEFTSKDRVLWHMVLPNGVEKDVTASANSSHCRGSGNILPYYTPPPGGKLENTLIGAELNSLYETYILTDSAVSDDIYQISGENVLIEINVIEGQYDVLLSMLINDYGLTVVNSDPDNLVITGWFPIINLLLLNDLPQYINFVRPVYPQIMTNSGLAINFGDYAMRSDFARNGFHVQGEGIKIGVLSNSYTCWIVRLELVNIRMKDEPCYKFCMILRQKPNWHSDRVSLVPVTLQQVLRNLQMQAVISLLTTSHTLLNPFFVMVL